MDEGGIGWRGRFLKSVRGEVGAPPKGHHRREMSWKHAYRIRAGVVRVVDTGRLPDLMMGGLIDENKSYDELVTHTSP